MTPITVFLFSLFILLHRVTPELAEKEKVALLSFITKVPHHPSYNWYDSPEPPCSTHWKGVTCDPTNVTVFFLRLPAARLVGEIPPNTIGTLTSLRILSLHTNGLNGTIPPDFSSLTTLTHLYLHNNNFSGKLPDINANDLDKLDVSFNNFTGSIPNSFSKFPKSAFSKNVDLCGDPLPRCKTTTPPSPPPSEQPAGDKKSKKKNVIIGVSIGSGVLLLFLLCLLRRKMYQQPPTPSLESASAVGAGAGTSTGGEMNKLVLLDAGKNRFDIEDLLQASAEVLGEGSVATSYKQVLEEKKMTVVVKWLKDVVVTKMEFELQMEVLGKMKNENVVPLKAYYYSIHEKCLVYDYMPGSLSTHLHGSIGLSGTQLGWNDRMRIALSAARGVAYLHAGNVVHGNIKPSNILLRHETNKDASVSDYGLNVLFGRWSSPYHRVTGYYAPEVLTTQTFTFESDVYSFGVLLLELLTGKAPNQTSLGEVQNNFPVWVQSVVREEPRSEIFDAELWRDHNTKEMVQVLRIAKDCVSTVPNQRPTMQEVVSMIEEMPRTRTYDWLRQSSDDPSKGYDYTPSTDTRDTPSTITP